MAKKTKSEKTKIDKASKMDKTDKVKTKSDNNRSERERRKNTSLRLDAKTLKALKMQAVKDDTSVQSILESLVTGYLNGKFKLD